MSRCITFLRTAWATGVSVARHGTSRRAGFFREAGTRRLETVLRSQDQLLLEAIMNWDRIRGNWKQFAGKAKERWGKLTDSDWTQIEGKRDQLVGKIQERYGIAKDEAERQVAEYEKRDENA
jgi:uncharacterized protein YjbJ (UPF0337 family)